MRWVGWVLLCICFLMAYLLRLSAGVLRIPLEADFALSATAFGAMSSMVFYAYTLMQIPVGALADSKGVRFTVTAGMTAAGAGAFIFSLAPAPWLLFVGRILMGMGVAVAFISSVLFLADNFSGELFGTLSGITSFIGNTGGILAQASLALMIAALTWRTTFSILGAVCLALALGCYLTIPSGGGGVPVSIASLAAGVRSVLSKWRIYPVCVSYTATSACSLVLSGTWGVSWVTSVLSRPDGPFFVSLLAAGTMCGAVAAGRMSDTMRSRKKPLILFAGCQVGVWIILTFAGHLLGDIALGTLFFFLGFVAGSIVVSWAIAKEMNPGHMGLAVAVINTAAFFGVAVITSLIGVFLDMGAALPAREAYRNAFLLPLGGAAIGFALSFMAPETFGGWKE
ncbi:MAG: MFS transporter [Aminivibrio sp.]|jgi:MFS family permease